MGNEKKKRKNCVALIWEIYEKCPSQNHTTLSTASIWLKAFSILTKKINVSSDYWIVRFLLYCLEWGPQFVFYILGFSFFSRIFFFYYRWAIKEKTNFCRMRIEKNQKKQRTKKKQKVSFSKITSKLNNKFMLTNFHSYSFRNIIEIHHTESNWKSSDSNQLIWL